MREPGDMKVKEAFDTIKQAMTDDEYALSWHCNIAMCCYDSIANSDGSSHDWAHKVSNDAASRFMKLCFDVETALPR
jgi:hypothetical protein